MAPRDGMSGVTLIEVLIVLVIVGVMAGVTTMGLGALDRTSQGAAEASRLADRLQLAADAAIVASTPLAFVHDERGYAFVEWDDAAGEWRASARRDLGTRRALPAGLRLDAGTAGGGAMLITPDAPPPAGGFTVTGAGAAWRVAFDGVTASVPDLGAAHALR